MLVAADPAGGHDRVHRQAQTRSPPDLPWLEIIPKPGPSFAGNAHSTRNPHTHIGALQPCDASMPRCLALPPMSDSFCVPLRFLPMPARRSALRGRRVCRRTRPVLAMRRRRSDHPLGLLSLLSGEEERGPGEGARAESEVGVSGGTSCRHPAAVKRLSRASRAAFARDSGEAVQRSALLSMTHGGHMVTALLGCCCCPGAVPAASHSLGER